MSEITDDLRAALRPFVVYAPEECFEGSKRFSLIETTEAGGGWFGTEDFQRAKEALAVPETAAQRPDLLTAARQMVSDYQTSQHHHPNHVLVPLAAFKAMQDAINAKDADHE